MITGKTKLIVDVDASIMREFDRDIKKRGNTRTWVVTNLLRDYILAVEEQPTYFHNATRKTAKTDTKRSKA